MEFYKVYVETSHRIKSQKAKESGINQNIETKK
jgi:hypothetical protein